MRHCTIKPRWAPTERATWLYLNKWNIKHDASYTKLPWMARLFQWPRGYVNPSSFCKVASTTRQYTCGEKQEHSTSKPGTSWTHPGKTLEPLLVQTLPELILGLVNDVIRFCQKPMKLLIPREWATPPPPPRPWTMISPYVIPCPLKIVSSVAVCVC